VGEVPGRERLFAPVVVARRKVQNISAGAVVTKERQQLAVHDVLHDEKVRLCNIFLFYFRYK
jgi:hypothetical protein